MSIPEPILLPTPQSIELMGGFYTSENEKTIVHDRIKPDEVAAEEGYTLTISDKVQITARSSIGIRHGHRTLNQLIRQYGRTLPRLIIEDYPSFLVRGVMLDISRDRMPTLEHLFETIELLASWKINHLQLYTEHTFAYKGHDVVWKDASPITTDEIQQIDEHCTNNGITLAANQNCFGHMTRWLKHKEYAHLAETVDGWYWGDMFRPETFSLCPTDPGSIRLVRDLLNQLLPNFTSGLVNIGCDETFDVGQGRSKQAVEKHGRAEVYFDFVDQVVEIARGNGFKPMLWADIALSRPESLERIPEDMIALAWGYEPDSPFSEWCSRLGSISREVWVCPGTSSWRSITGRTYERHHNIVNAARQGLDSGAIGFMVTDWGDLGHRQQFPISLHGLAEAANAAWNVESAPDYDSSVSSLHAFNDYTGKVGRWLDKLGDADLSLRNLSPHLCNASVIFTDLHEPFQNSPKRGDLNDWEDVADILTELSDSLPSANNKQLSDELKHTLDVAKFAVDRAILRRQSDNLNQSNVDRLGDRMRDIIEEHRRLWLLRSRPGGLDDSCRYYQKVIEYLR